MEQKTTTVCIGPNGCEDEISEDEKRHTQLTNGETFLPFIQSP